MDPQKNNKTYSEPEDLADPYRKDRLEAFYIEKYEKMLNNEANLSSETVNKRAA